MHYSFVRCFVQNGFVRCFVQYGFVQYDFVQYGVVKYGIVQYSFVRRPLVRRAGRQEFDRSISIVGGYCADHVFYHNSGAMIPPVRVEDAQAFGISPTITQTQSNNCTQPESV